MYAYVFTMMILMHTLDDFFFQSRTMANMKQKSYWQNYPDKYRNDWIPVLILHGLEWSAMVAIPFVFLPDVHFGWEYLALVFANAFIHSYVDHLKCNKFVINLKVDQSIHIIQVVEMFIIGVLVL